MTASRTPVPSGFLMPSAGPQQVGPSHPDPRRLHEATDKLNSRFLDFEAALNELKLGVSASVLMDSNADGWEQYLGFRKQQGSFKLVVEAGWPDQEDTWNTTAITSASREIRLQAVELLPELYKKLLEAFEAEITRVNKGIEQVEELARAIRSKAGK